MFSNFKIKFQIIYLCQTPCSLTQPMIPMQNEKLVSAGFDTQFKIGR